MDPIIAKVEKIIKHKDFMNRSALCNRSMDRLVALGRIKKYIDIVRKAPPKNVKKMVLYLEPDLRKIMPGIESKFREKMINTLEEILIECKS